MKKAKKHLINIKRKQKTGDKGEKIIYLRIEVKKMGAYKDKEKGTWYVNYRYKNEKGEKIGHTKRGFKTKREAVAYEIERKQQIKEEEMKGRRIKEIVPEYLKEKAEEVKESTYRNIELLMEKHVVRWLGEKRIGEVTEIDLRLKKLLKSTELMK